MNPVDDPIIKNEANSIVRGEENPYLQALMLYDFISRKIDFNKDLIPSGAIMALKNKKAQCCDAVYLYVSLCRALGIPARYVGGLFLAIAPDIKKKFAIIDETHAWAEVYFPGTGWVPVDVSLGRFDSRSRYYCFAEQRNVYIPIWRDMMNPIQGSMKGNGEKKLSINLFFRAKEVKPSMTMLRMSSSGNNYWIKGEKIVSSTGKIRGDDPSPTALRKFREAQKLMDERKYEKAATLFREALFISPNYLPALQGIVKAFFKMGSLEMLEKELLSTLNGNQQDPLAHYALGLCYTYNQSYSKALRELRKAQKMGVDSSDFHNTLGYIFIETKQVPKAYGQILRAIQLNPGSKLAYSNMLSLFHRLDAANELIRWGEKALAKFPNEATFMAEIGFGYLCKNDISRAERYLLDAVKKDPENGYFRSLLGTAYLEGNNKIKAVEELRKGLSLGVPPTEKEFFIRMLEKATR